MNLFSQPLKDWHLFLLVTSFVLIDVVILIIATAVPQARLEAVLFPDSEHEDGGFNVSVKLTIKS